MLHGVAREEQRRVWQASAVKFQPKYHALVFLDGLERQETRLVEYNLKRRKLRFNFLRLIQCSSDQGILRKRFFVI
jgi:hypothetical protein